MTQEQLASDLNTAVRNVQRIEGGTQNLTLRTIARIAAALGVTPEDLLRG
jgi:transcriptional regulator with XRE-family HTH domain